MPKKEDPIDVEALRRDDKAIEDALAGKDVDDDLIKALIERGKG